MIGFTHLLVNRTISGFCCCPHQKQTNPIVFSVYSHAQRTPKTTRMHTIHTHEREIISNFSFLSPFIRTKSTSERLSHKMCIIHIPVPLRNAQMCCEFVCVLIIFLHSLSGASHDINIFVVEYINCQRLKFIVYLNKATNSCLRSILLLVPSI